MDGLATVHHDPLQVRFGWVGFGWVGGWGGWVGRESGWVGGWVERLGWVGRWVERLGRGGRVCLPLIFSLFAFIFLICPLFSLIFPYLPLIFPYLPLIFRGGRGVGGGVGGWGLSGGWQVSACSHPPTTQAQGLHAADGEALSSEAVPVPGDDSRHLRLAAHCKGGSSRRHLLCLVWRTVDVFTVVSEAAVVD